ncbi:MAG: NAD(P)/FAD-dependent oxidoreductase [Sphingobium sp.]
MLVESDVIVVGAGIAGSGVATELASDRRVTLLEQESHPGIHATGRSAALHSEIYGNPCIRQLTKASRDFFLEGADGMVFATPRGCVHIATEAQRARLEDFEAQTGVGPAVERIDARELHRLVPVLRPDVAVAALAERHAYDLDVDAIQRHFLGRLRRHGGSVYCDTPALEITFAAGKWTITTPDRAFRAPVLVNAAGPWGDVVAARAQVRAIGLEPKRRTAALIDPPQGVNPVGWPAVIDIDERFYFKPEAGKILVSPADETPSEPCDAYPEDLDVAIAVDRVQQVADILATRVSHRWAGLRTFTADRTPAVGYDAEAPGFFWLVGQGGYGIQTSPALSRLAAALVRKGPAPDDLLALGVNVSDLSPTRFNSEAPGAQAGSISGQTTASR